MKREETPLDGKLGHRLLDVYNEGQRARDEGTRSPYGGQSLEHCLHAAGWVSRDLQLALEAATNGSYRAWPVSVPARPVEKCLTCKYGAHNSTDENLHRAALHCLDCGLPDYPHYQPLDASDPVSHPPHYTGHPSGVECIQITEHMNFCRGNAVKYIWRAGEKGNEVQDLEKAKWYIQREIDRLKKAVDGT